MEALGAVAEPTVAGQPTMVATRVAAICDKIKEHRDAGKPMSVKRAAAISANVDDITADDAEAIAIQRTAVTKKPRKGSARWEQEVSRLCEGKCGVVAKSVRPGSGDGDVADLLREACFMAACRGHPSLVGYRGVTYAPDSEEYSLVVDCDGPSLVDVLRDCSRPFPEANVRRIMRQLLGGAKAMDKHGIIHRDIKPANILFGSGGTVKICNFSVAKSLAEKDPPTLFAGTNGYTAPEVLLQNTEHDTLVDVWSLGCVMMELLIGRLPFAGKDETDQLFRIFEILGVPGRKAMQALKPQVLANEVQQWQAQQRRVGHGNQLRELVPEQVLSQDGFEVLNGLLTCDPKKRLTAAAALQCPWFTDNIDDTLVLPTVVSKIVGAATESWSLVCQVAVAFAGRALELLRPKAL